MIQIKINTYNLFDKLRLRIAVLLMFTGLAVPAQAQLSGNPLFTGADPEIHYFNNKYYIYTTAIYGTQFHAYSSNDLTNWVDEGLIFDLYPDSPWSQNNGWAPAVVFRNNKYYFYYTAETKIGCAVGNTPIGPLQISVHRSSAPILTQTILLMPMFLLTMTGKLIFIMEDQEKAKWWFVN